MLAFFVTLAVLAFWSLLGHALLALLASGRALTRNFLLAPTLGLMFSVVALVVLNRLGIPLRLVCWPFALTSILASALVLWFNPMPLRLWRVAPYAACCVLGLLLVGWPLFRFGFDWISYANDDLANYCVRAECLARHGWYDPVDLDSLIDGRDAPQASWFPLRVDMERCGAEIILSWLAGMTGRSPFAVSMPLLLALHGALILAAGGLVWRGRNRRTAALVTCLLVAVSAPLALGTLNQLLGQTGGLALLCTAAALGLRPVRRGPWSLLLRQALLLGLVLTAVVTYYAEILPFLGVGFVGYVLLALKQKRFRPASVVVVIAAGLISLALLQRYLPGSGILFPLHQLRHGASHAVTLNSLFPYFLVPEGFANLWGLKLLFVPIGEPWLSAGVVGGSLLLLLATFGAFRLAMRNQPVGLITSVMLALAAFLLVRESGFGLFKIAMFLQPFLLGTLAVVWARLSRLQWLAAVPLVVVACSNLWVQRNYTLTSFGASSFGELKWASEDALLRRLAKRLHRSSADYYLLDTPSSFLGKAAAVFGGGRRIETPVYLHFVHRAPESLNPALSSAEQSHFLELFEQMESKVQRRSFDLHATGRSPQRNDFDCLGLDGRLQAEKPVLIAGSGRLSLFNRFRYPADREERFYQIPLNQVRNHLIFVHSQHGKQYFYSLGDSDRTAMYQLESDYFYPQTTMAGMGRHVLCEVINPADAPRLLLDLTTTLAANGDCRLPEAAVIGEQRVPLPLTGRGSARVLSDPVTPQTIERQHYLSVDLGDRAFQFAPKPSVWNRLSGRSIGDRRKLTCFCRNISLLSQSEHEALNPPTMLVDPRSDITHPALEFSGLYEDGWLSEHAWFRPTRADERADLIVEMMVPDLGDPAFRTTLTIRVDGREVIRKELPPGESKIRESVSGLSRRPKVELIFSHTQRLPGGDNRIATAQLQRLGFEPLLKTSVKGVSK